MGVLIPVFLILIFLEYKLSVRKQLKLYFGQESFAHLLTGTGQQIFNLLYFALTFVPYRYVQENHAIVDWNLSLVPLSIMTFFLVDFLWYWAHRGSHRVNLLVASHITHHQAEDYNLLSALRQSWTSRLIIFVFFLPLAFLGIKPEIVMVSQLISSFIQFLTHLGVNHLSFGRLDKVLISPATHFAHHGINEPYLDKNFGGVFSFWDVLFGTYQALDPAIAPVIGIKNKIDHHDPFEANLNYFRRIFFVLQRSVSAKAKFLAVFGSPEFLGQELKRHGYREAITGRSYRSISRQELVMLVGLFLGQFVVVLGTTVLWKEAAWVERIALFCVSLGLIWVTAKYQRSLAAREKEKSFKRGSLIIPTGNPFL